MEKSNPQYTQSRKYPEFNGVGCVDIIIKLKLDR